MVNATFGTVEYRDGGGIAVPLTFPENVIAPSKSIFEITHVSGDALTDMEYRLIGQNTAFKLIFEVPPDRKGSFQVSANGDVFKVSSGTWENVGVATPKTVSYNTIVPRIVNWDVPGKYELGVPVDIRIAYNVQVTGWNANNILTEHGIFILEGANLGQASPYKWVGTSPPDFNVTVPADLSGTDWQALAPPPPGAPTPGMNGFSDDGNQWHGEEGQYFLIRFPDPQEVGIFNLTSRDGGVRGPIS